MSGDALEFSGPRGRETQAGIELRRVGTCMAWQWMCPNYCGHVLGINADKASITDLARRHLAWCDDA